MGTLTVAEIKKKLAHVNSKEFEVLKRSLCADERKGVLDALQAAQRRLVAQRTETERLEGLYSQQIQLVADRNKSVAINTNFSSISSKLIIGLDEVGRGPLAGPLTIGAVVLPDKPCIPGLNDSKQLKPAVREQIAKDIRKNALACEVVFIQPQDIDEQGMTACLKKAFKEGVERIESLGIEPVALLLDGNPLHIDKREINVVSGDAKCASIAAASIVAKVARDHYMCKISLEYPEYGWENNKGYGSASHIQAIKERGLCPYHRRSFCGNFLQESLFS